MPLGRRKVTVLMTTLRDPGYRYIPLSDAQMSQYLFSTLFLRLDLTTRPMMT